MTREKLDVVAIGDERMRILEAASTVTRGFRAVKTTSMSTGFPSIRLARIFVEVSVYYSSATRLRRRQSTHSFSFFTTLFTRFKHADAEHSGDVLLIEKEGKGFAHSEDIFTFGAFPIRRDKIHSDLCDIIKESKRPSEASGTASITEIDRQIQ